MHGFRLSGDSKFAVGANLSYNSLDCISFAK